MFEAVTTENEVVSLVALAHEIWHEHYTPIVGKEQVNYMLQKLHSVAVVLAQIKNQRFYYYLIKDDDQNIGYLAIQIRENDIFLSKLYIKLDCRGGGVGRKALMFIKQKARDKRRTVITLRVNKDNLKSIGAYYQLGFKQTGEACTSIGGSYVMDDLIMQLAID